MVPWESWTQSPATGLIDWEVQVVRLNNALQDQPARRGSHRTLCAGSSCRGHHGLWTRKTTEGLLPAISRWHFPLKLCFSFVSDNHSQVSRASLRIRILDVNDNPPELATPYEAAVCEDAKPGQVSGAPQVSFSTSGGPMVPAVLWTGASLPSLHLCQNISLCCCCHAGNHFAGVLSLSWPAGAEACPWLRQELMVLHWFGPCELGPREGLQWWFQLSSSLSPHS